MATRSLSSFDRAVMERIRELAAKKRMTQTAVATAAGLSTSKFNRYWNGQDSIKLGEVDRVLRALGTTPVDEAQKIFDLLIEASE